MILYTVAHSHHHVVDLTVAQIRRYVEAYAAKSPRQSHDARMTDIDLNQMVFSVGEQTSTVTFDPPMKSLREARERLVQMTRKPCRFLAAAISLSLATSHRM
jgi:putative heme iron utilization protein